ncbi:MAG TPA: excinuclease ABC subunit UvrA [Chloroflexota bacterium]|nr:excinuclease ABC subunit UvrA [Chloroflexota bacterium]
MPLDRIEIRGARQHNLKNIDLVLPRDKLVVITGLSGSGKSSLAFDTIYAEGQRRYVESLSSYARQFLGQMDKPDVEYISGLSPAISIDQKGASHNPRSTVGTVTEIYDYLRLLFARVGHPHCPKCHRPIQQQSSEQIIDAVLDMPEGARIMVLAPLVESRKGEFQSVFEDVRKAGFVRVRVDGEIRDLSDKIDLEKQKKHSIAVVVDRLVVSRQSEDKSRIADSVEQALRLGSGQVIISEPSAAGDAAPTWVDRLYSESFACPYDGTSLPALEPRSFSFNTPHGACPTCTGLGTRLEVDPDLILANKELSLAQGAIAAWGKGGWNGNSYYRSLLESVSKHYGFSMTTPIRDLKPDQIQKILYGSGTERIALTYASKSGRSREYRAQYEGIIPNIERRFKETESEFIREELAKYMSPRPCPTCKGARLKPEVLAVTIAGRNIAEVVNYSVLRARDFFAALEDRVPYVPAAEDTHTNGAVKAVRSSSRATRTAIAVSDPYADERGLTLTDREFAIGRQILKEIRERLRFLVDVGLDYLTLSRTAATLSGGEAQRIRLATQIGSGLTGVLYILDEPSIGLHQRDNERLIRTLQRLRDLGNTLIVVEHDEETMRSADWIVDMGPGAGEHGGRIVAEGTIEDIMSHAESLTGQFLNGTRAVPIPRERRTGNKKWVRILGARENNLKDITAEIPLGRLVCITGVSGSGKSSLVTNTLFPALSQRLFKSREAAGAHDSIDGLEHLDKVIEIDQSPIGRTPRSNPATYVGLFTPMRDLFSQVPESRVRGYQPGRFSFNVKGGRCEACQGDGILKIEMQFLPDVYVPCEVCHGKRYNRETLEIKFKGYSVADVLEMTVEEALGVFDNIPTIAVKLRTLSEVGLGYIHLGQPATTLSGGEAQRVKLSTELSRRATGRTMYILDEPTTGLHFADVEHLLALLGRLVDAGNTVVIIEHNLDVIKTADWVIDLGPEGGDAGGEIIATGTPEAIAANPASYTGAHLRHALTPAKKRSRQQVAALSC